MRKCLYIATLSVLCASCGGSGDAEISQTSDDLADQAAVVQNSDDIPEQAEVNQNPDAQEQIEDSQQPAVIPDQVTPDQAAPDQAVEDTSIISDDSESVSQSVENSFPFVALITDPVWRVCDVDIGTDSSDAWQNFEVLPGRSETRVCIKACPTDDSFIPDPDFPGLGWDNTLSTACAVISPAMDTRFSEIISTVPLYLPDQQPSRQTFTNIGAFQVHAGGGQWQCSHQQRNLSSDSFTDTGVEITYQFNGDGTANVQKSGGSQTTTRWFFDRNFGTRVLAVGTGSPFDGNTIPATYIGNVQVDTNNMTIYRTTVDRLLCTSERPDDTLAGLPESPEQIAELPALLIDDLLGEPLSCAVYDATELCIDCQSFTAVGEASNFTSSSEPVFININQSAVVDASGQVRYEFESDSGATYTVNEEGTFDSFFIRQGASTFSSAEVTFRQFNDRIIMTESARSGGSGSSSATNTSSVCFSVTL